MAEDYQPMLARGIAGLKENNSRTRSELYERTRTRLETELRRLSADESTIAQELQALDAEIQRIEAKAAAASVSSAASGEPAKDYKCDICGARVHKASGYCYTTTQVVTSIGYWNKLFQSHPQAIEGDGSSVAALVPAMIHHNTPWLVCEPCAALVNADAKAAREYATSGKWPPGCGPAEQFPAAMAAASAWSLIRGEWPTSVQIGDNAVTHDSSKGTRCDFCRRIVYGAEKFAMFAPEMYADLLSGGARFIRNPSPSQEIQGKLYLISCMTCLERSGANAAGASTATTTAVDSAANGERYCNHHRKVIQLEPPKPDSSLPYTLCSASFSTHENSSPCINSFCIHNILAMALAEPVLEQRGLEVAGASQADLQRILLSMGLKDEAPSPPAKKGAGKACFVATACYGDPDAPEVAVLRHYRDRHLRKHLFGRLLIRIYYAVSPRLAAWLVRNPRARAAVRQSALQPLVRVLRSKAD